MVSRTNRFRGRIRTHGRGKKAGRGAGKRGGRGNAGINKHRLFTRLKYMPGHWGRQGFSRRPGLRTRHTVVNVGVLESLAAGAGTIDLNVLGHDKLLASGRVTKPLTVTVAHATASAVEKVESAGGSVVLEAGDDEWGEWEEE